MSDDTRAVEWLRSGTFRGMALAYWRYDFPAMVRSLAKLGVFGGIPLIVTQNWGIAACCIGAMLVFEQDQQDVMDRFNEAKVEASRQKREQERDEI